MSAVPATSAAATTTPEADWPRPGVAWYMVIVLMVAYILSFIDRVILPTTVDLSAWRSLVAAAGLAVLLYGLIWDTA